MVDGYPIRFHEPCAVFSNGSGAIPDGGMEDEEVLFFYKHGETVSGCGLKCTLCKQTGATTGCCNGPCSMVLHYPCARAMALERRVTFSLVSRDMACQHHLNYLPQPHEGEFLGMWLEGGGGWNGIHAPRAEREWPALRARLGRVIAWEPLRQRLMLLVRLLYPERQGGRAQR